MVASQQEDDISLALVDVVVFEKEDFVDSIRLELTELDKQADGTS